MMIRTLPALVVALVSAVAAPSSWAGATESVKSAASTAASAVVRAQNATERGVKKAASATEHGLQVEVGDTGPGVPEEIRERLHARVAEQEAAEEQDARS